MPMTYREHRGHASDREHRPYQCHTEAMPMTENTEAMPVTYREHRGHTNGIQRTQRPYQWHTENTEANNSCAASEQMEWVLLSHVDDKSLYLVGKMEN